MRKIRGVVFILFLSFLWVQLCQAEDPPHPVAPVCEAVTPDSLQWFGYGSAGYGLMRWDGETVEWFTVAGGQIINNAVHELAVDRDGRLWIRESGLTMYNGVSWKHFFPGTGGRVIGIDREGNFWSYGLTHYDTHQKMIITFQDSVWIGYMAGIEGEYLSFNGDYLVEADTCNGRIGFDGDHWILIESEGQPANDLQHGSWWFPLSVGNEWLYKRTDGGYPLPFEPEDQIIFDDTIDTVVSAVIGTKTIGGRLYYVMLDGSLYRSDGHDVIAFYRQTGEETIAWDFTTCNPDRHGIYNEKICYFRDVLFGSSGRIRCKVEVPAGTFTGYRIFNNNTDSFEFSIHEFAEGIGLSVYRHATDFGGEEILELISYSITPPAPVKVDDVSRPETFNLAAAPNPFNPSTTITFSVAALGDTRLTVYNLAGQMVDTLVNRALMPGDYSVTWSGHDADGMQMASGIYFIRLESGGKIATVKATMVK